VSAQDVADLVERDVLLVRRACPLLPQDDVFVLQTDQHSARPRAGDPRALGRQTPTPTPLLPHQPAQLGHVERLGIPALLPQSITKDSMRRAFAAYAESHEAASIRRCWSTWNTLCSYLFTGDILPANPMELVGRPKAAKTLPKSLPRSAAQALVDAIDSPAAVKRRTDWPERDRAVILTALLAGLRAQELRGANIGDLRLTQDRGGVLHVRGKGKKDRAVPIEPALIEVLNAYLASRATRFPSTSHRHGDGAQLNRWPASTPLFVGTDGHRITRGALQYRVLRAFKLAGPDAPRQS
jgi:integrase/recombinase XerC